MLRNLRLTNLQKSLSNPLGMTTSSGLGATVPTTASVTAGLTGTTPTVNTGTTNLTTSLGNITLPNLFGRLATPSLGNYNQYLQEMEKTMTPAFLYSAASAPILANARAGGKARAGQIRARGLGAGLAAQMGRESAVETGGLLSQAALSSMAERGNLLSSLSQLELARANYEAGLRGQDLSQNTSWLQFLLGI